ncbi:hypothetical protein [Dokdonia sp.]|uniref:hypothetical protein n=1 Tax=Dokdonia sp. TaxID=2024995 RepID=UPI0032669637
MDAKLIVARLKQANYKYSEGKTIKELLRQLPLSEQISIRNGLIGEKTKADNSDIIDVINDIINVLGSNR